MNHPQSLGRLLGGSMLFAFAVGMFSNFKLQTDLFDGAGLLVNAAAHPGKIGLICVLGLLTALASVWVATLLVHRFGSRAPGTSRLYLAIVTAGLTLSLVECSTLLAFHQLSTQYHAAPAETSSTFAAAGGLLSGMRNGVHFLDKLLGGTGIFVLFLFLFSQRLLPRLLAGFGMLAAAMQMIAVGRAVFGFEVEYLLLAPLSLVFLIVPGWLLVRGFPAADPAASSEPGSRPLAQAG